MPVTPRIVWIVAIMLPTSSPLQSGIGAAGYGAPADVETRAPTRAGRTDHRGRHGRRGRSGRSRTLEARAVACDRSCLDTSRTTVTASGGGPGPAVRRQRVPGRHRSSAVGPGPGCAPPNAPGPDRVLPAGTQSTVAPARYADGRAAGGTARPSRSRVANSDPGRRGSPRAGRDRFGSTLVRIVPPPLAMRLPARWRGRAAPPRSESG